MEVQRLSQLIGLIYDAAQDLDLWPLLLQELAEEIHSGSGGTVPFPQVESIERLGDYVSHWYDNQLDETAPESQGSQFVHFSGKEHELIDTVLPHLVRALRLNRSLYEMSSENRAFASVLEHLPIGMLVMDCESRVYAKNRRFDALLVDQGALNIRAGHLAVSNAEDHKLLSSMLREVANASADSTQGQALRLSGQSPVSLMVLPLYSDEHLHTRPRVIVFVASSANQLEIEPSHLQAIYDLSKAESRLTIALVNGLSLDEISEQYHVSKHTLRTQLKSIYTKTSSSRQAELVVKVLTSPVILSTQVGVENIRQFIIEDITIDRDERHNQRMFLSDGRCLSFAEYGAEDGYPVVMVHGLTGSRFQVCSDEQILKRHGIRLYIPERPGYGGSDPLHDRRILDWATDLEQFIDFLGVQQVALMGYSVGGSFAMAAARALKDRISHLTLISSMAQFKSMSDLDGMSPLFRMLLGLGRYTPSIAMTFMRLVVRSTRNNPDRYFERITKTVPKVDRELFDDPQLRQSYVYSMYEAVRQGERDLLMELLLTARDWGFPVEEVNVPVTLWHGELDNYVPSHMARTLASRLPNARLNLIPEAGHMLLYRIWDEIVATLVTDISKPDVALSQ